MKPIRKRTAEELTTAYLREEIVSGRLAPAERLTEMELSSSLEVSRATVRTALHQLVGEGLVVQVPYSGSMVANLTSRDAWELYTLRAALEGLAARLAATKITPEGSAKLEAAYDRLREAAGSGDNEQTTQADFAFHQQIVQLASHLRLEQQYRIVGQQVRMMISSSNALLPGTLSVLEQHQQIAQAVLQGHADEAALLSEQHNHSEGEKLVTHLNRLEEQRQD